MRSRRHLSWWGAIALLSMVLAGCKKEPAPIQPPRSIPPTVAKPPSGDPTPPSPPKKPVTPSIERLRSVVEDLCQDYRFSGSPSEREAAGYLVSRLEAIGYAVQVQRFRLP